jgi:hypothetical protein
MPRRLRYDSLTVEPAPDAEAGTLALRFGRVHWGARQLERLTLHWQRSGALAGLALLRDAELGPPLPSWPDDRPGTLPERLRLPLGPGLSDDEKRQQWSALPAPDREFLLDLLAALPEAAARVPPALAGADAGTQPWVAAAQALWQEARHDTLPMMSTLAMPTPSLLRRVARRLRHPSPTVN